MFTNVIHGANNYVVKLLNSYRKFLSQASVFLCVVLEKVFYTTSSPLSMAFIFQKNSKKLHITKTKVKAVQPFLKQVVLTYTSLRQAKSVLKLARIDRIQVKAFLNIKILRGALDKILCSINLL